MAKGEVLAGDFQGLSDRLGGREKSGEWEGRRYGRKHRGRDIMMVLGREVVHLSWGTALRGVGLSFRFWDLGLRSCEARVRLVRANGII